MRAFSQIVFDDIVQGVAPVYTDPVYNGLLGLPDRMAIQAISNVFSGGPSLTIAVEHSADERTWSQRSTSPEVDRVSLSWTDTNNHVASYNNGGSVACYVRFRIELSGAAIVRVKIAACGRSHRKWQPIALGFTCACRGAPNAERDSTLEDVDLPDLRRMLRERAGSAHRDRPDRAIVIASIGHGDHRRSEATPWVGGARFIWTFRAPVSFSRDLSA